MFESILVPIDGSETSRLAVPTALQLARRMGARLHFVQVHVVEIAAEGGPPRSADESEEEARREAEREQLAALVQEAEGAGLSARAELLEGPIARALERYAEAQRIDLVVMTTHARTGITRMVLGSVADAIVRRTCLPVLLLRPDALPADPAQGFQRIAVALDGSDRAEQVIGHALEIRNQSGELILVRVVGHLGDAAPHLGALPQFEQVEQEQVAARDYLAGVAARIAQRTPQVRPVSLQRQSAASGVLDAAAQAGADLIALTTRGRSGLPRALLGSVADQVLRAAQVPVLLVRQRRDQERAGWAQLAFKTAYL